MLPSYPLKSLIFRDHRDVRIPADDVGSGKETKITLRGFHEKVREVNRVAHRHGGSEQKDLQTVGKEPRRLRRNLRIDTVLGQDLENLGIVSDNKSVDRSRLAAPK